MLTTRRTGRAIAACTILMLTALARTAGAQNAPATGDSSDVDMLVARALATNPTIRAAAARLRAARAAVAPAGARPDPMLMGGIVNLPIARPGFTDFMTMKMIGVSQTIPYPGKLALRTRAARADADATRATLAAARLDVARQVRDAYYDLAFSDRELALLDADARSLNALQHAAASQYAAGTAPQSDALRASVESARLAQRGATTVEDRRAALARLNALLDRPADTPVPHPALPPWLVATALPDSARNVRFTSDSLGARVTDSPLLPLDSLYVLAGISNAAVREHIAAIAAQRARVRSARIATRPDFDVSLQYGQRSGYTDMVTATVAIPIPLQRGRKQDAEVDVAAAQLDALEAEHHAMLDQLGSELAREYGDAEGARSRLALESLAVLPRARAALSAALSAYQVGRTPFATVVDAQQTVLDGEISYERALADFAKAIAALDETTGTQVLRQEQTR